MPVESWDSKVRASTSCTEREDMAQYTLALVVEEDRDTVSFCQHLLREQAPIFYGNKLRYLTEKVPISGAGNQKDVAAPLELSNNLYFVGRAYFHLHYS